MSALTREPDTSRMQLFLEQQEPGELAISAWVATEFSAALSIKVRTGHIDVQQRSVSLAAFRRLMAESFVIFPVSDACYRVAGSFADQHSPGIRAGDALHLALCAEHGATLCTLDRRLAHSGQEVGVPTKLL